MVIVLEKALDSMRIGPPPPPYSQADPPPFRDANRVPKSLITLPSHLLLRIVYGLFPQVPDKDRGTVERQRLTLYWINTSLRLVCKPLYIASMHVLRSTYLPSYSSLIRRPYSSDPFPYIPSDAAISSQSAIQSRETKVLDLFISLKVREDVYMDDSEFHLEREESFKDLFDLMQPKSRIEDLVRVYGLKEAVVCLSDQQTSSSSRQLAPVCFSTLSVSFSSRKVGLVMTGKGTKRTIVEVPRTKDEKLEVAAKRLVKELKAWLIQTR